MDALTRALTEAQRSLRHLREQMARAPGDEPGAVPVWVVYIARHLEDQQALLAALVRRVQELEGRTHEENR